MIANRLTTASKSASERGCAAARPSVHVARAGLRRATSGIRGLAPNPTTDPCPPTRSAPRGDVHGFDPHTRHHDCHDGRFFMDKRYRGIRIGMRVGLVTQEQAGQRLQREMRQVDLDHAREANRRPRFADCAERYPPATSALDRTRDTAMAVQQVVLV
jgi:hypothetical protein